ncbi:MAG: family N-acetyltransferase [Bacteroidetes bacterium]|jgi:GNAT superfamily N-acetyltransferase|nr:family N-acetyltransferase [Bacteroidota bacterium]
MYTIKIIPKDELESIFPLVKLLNPDTEEKILRERLDDMLQRNYECIGAYDNEKLIGISGIWILNKLYVGKHIEPDNVIIDPAYRGKGVGEKLIQWICDYGKTQGCIASELNCYLQNEKGIEFWKNQGYKILGYHFQKQL